MRLISKPAHTPNQCVEDKENSVPKTTTKPNIYLKGKLANIKERVVPPTQSKVSSPASQLFSLIFSKEVRDKNHKNYFSQKSFAKSKLGSDLYNSINKK